MDAEINNVIYMELNSGPKIANSTCGKTIIAGTTDRDSTVHVQEVGEGAIAKNAELVKGVTLKRKLCQIQITQIQKSISSLINLQTTLTDLRKIRKFY